jgi:hypothetical protein
MEVVSLLLIVCGIVGLSQPWLFIGYRYGFTVLLVGVVGFTFFSHRRPVR